jgi:hypothetical protein
MTFITQAIETKYLGATNTKGGRIKAMAWAGSVTVPYAHELTSADAHRVAADALIAKMGWTGTFAQGGNVKGTGYYFVNIEGASDLLAALHEVLSLCDRDSDIGRVCLNAIIKTVREA